MPFLDEKADRKVVLALEGNGPASESSRLSPVLQQSLKGTSARHYSSKVPGTVHSILLGGDDRKDRLFHSSNWVNDWYNGPLDSVTFVRRTADGSHETWTGADPHQTFRLKHHGPPGHAVVFSPQKQGVGRDAHLFEGTATVFSDSGETQLALSRSSKPLDYTSIGVKWYHVEGSVDTSVKPWQVYTWIASKGA